MSAPSLTYTPVWALSRPDFTAAAKPHGGFAPFSPGRRGDRSVAANQKEEEVDPRSWLAL
jgi:hypothetical protein